jgi:prolipoprotein diacylglyceryltransferase
MPVAFLPSPPRAAWHIGPLPVRAYALCLVAGVVLGIWVASQRYRRAGGRPGVILDVATWAVPCGLVGARLYSVISDYNLYFGPGRDWLQMVRVWDGGLSVPGAIAGGAFGAWLACRRAGVSLAGGGRGGRPGAGVRPGPRVLGKLVHPAAIRAAIGAGLGSGDRPGPPAAGL